ncbi:MAG TPA: beta-N-acetylhexosaminidase [Nevskiaceae bacterium]|nr:beta-N-acetylhexosaminidase [Nevskiaceae bacterium]
MKKKLIGPLMLDVAGHALTAEDRDLLRHPLCGGVILFTRNYADRAQLKALCDDILALKSPRLLLAADYEGGRVQRFHEGFTRIPAMRTLGHLHDSDPRAALDQARAHATTIGNELGAFGIDLCFAPVLDLDRGVSSVIGDRGFASQPLHVADLARAFVAGLKSTGMAATGKHFPGHGSVVPDSHLELPVDPRPFDEIEHEDLVPFRALIAQEIDSIMTAHVRYTQVDQTPASHSKRWISGYLRRTLGFRGAVFSDDMSMKGAAAIGSLSERARMALDAGTDMLPVCNDRPSALRLLDDLATVKISPAKSARLARLYRKDVQ